MAHPPLSDANAPQILTCDDGLTVLFQGINAGKWPGLDFLLQDCFPFFKSSASNSTQIFIAASRSIRAWGVLITRLFHENDRPHQFHSSPLQILDFGALGESNSTSHIYGVECE